MKKIFSRYGFMVFLLISTVHLVTVIFGLELPGMVTKALLMPALAVTVFSGTRGRYRLLIVVALFFSFIGDVLLLFDRQHPLFFIAGLVAFLITHILYIRFFTRLKKPFEGLKTTGKWVALIVVLYGAGLVYLLYPSLGNLKIAVMLYALIICCMLVCAINCFTAVVKKARWMFVSGALLFVASDSLLALNKFYQSFPAAAFFIMFTYCAAQYFIAKGFVVYKRSRYYP